MRTARLGLAVVAAAIASTVPLPRAHRGATADASVAREIAPVVRGGGAQMVLHLSRDAGLHQPACGCTRPPDSMRLEQRRRFTPRHRPLASVRGDARPRALSRPHHGPRCDVLDGTLVSRRAKPRSVKVAGGSRLPARRGALHAHPVGGVVPDVPEVGSVSLAVQPFVFEAGPGDANCRHDVVIPFPGGLGVASAASAERRLVRADRVRVGIVDLTADPTSP
jgi:hypothetical protein